MTQLEAEKLTMQALTSLYAENRHQAAALLDETRLDAGDFTTNTTQALFTALSGAMRDDQALDVVALAQSLKGRVPVAMVSDIVCSSEGFMNPGLARSRAQVLRDAARRRRIVESLTGLLGLFRGPTDTEACLGEAEKVMRELGGEAGVGLRSLEPTMMALAEKLEAVQNGTRESTLASGIDALDYAIGGLQPTLTIIGALPGIGKSALIAAIARNLASRGRKVGVLSLEDERDWLTERIVAEAAAVPLFVLGNKPLAPSQMERVNGVADGVYAMLQNLLVDDSPAMSPAQVVASARSMVARGCAAVIVDHLGEIRLNRSERHDLDVLEALQDLRSIAKTYRVPVVVCCHLRRREGLNVDSVPRLTDFAFSAAIERCARVALGLFRPKTEAGSGGEQLGVEVMKQTKGPRDFNFRLNVGALYGLVQQTPVPSSMRQEFGSWRDE